VNISNPSSAGHGDPILERYKFVKGRWASLLACLLVAGCTTDKRNMTTSVEWLPDGGQRVVQYYVDAEGKKVLHGKCVTVSGDGLSRSVEHYNDGVLVGVRDASTWRSK
jgi:hypothetical protein